MADYQPSGPGTSTRRRPRRPERGKHRILQSTAMLPGLLTISNGLAGFAAIHFATKDALGYAMLGNLAIAAYLIFLAMFFDMLDGRVARMTRRTSDFGGQLDSLCDVISFGAAPAVLMVRTVIMAIRGHQIQPIILLDKTAGTERVIWCIAGLYLACAALRLARFNVENEPDESRHLFFRGLPSPGAAATVAAMVLLFDHIVGIETGWRAGKWMLVTVSLAMPVATLAVALLMVSRFRYTHIVNQYIRGRRPFNYLVKLVVLGLVAMLDPFVALALVTVTYSLSGPVGAAWRLIRQRQAPAGPSDT